MEQENKSRWEGKEHWFKFGHVPGLKRFENIKSLDSTAATIALRTIKYHLEEVLGFEITDELFVDIFTKVCNLHPVTALGGMAGLEFVTPLRRILKEHGVSENKVGAIWSMFRVKTKNQRCYEKILLHVPHSSAVFPQESVYSFNDLDEQEKRLIDYYTDELFVPNHSSDKINSAVFPYCRLYCDVERLINDPLETRGLGIRYSWGLTEHVERHLSFSFSSKEESFRLYSDFHTKVSNTLVRQSGIDDDILLIDCHSFSHLPNLLNSNPPDIDICIGYNDDETCPNKVVIGNIARFFESFGYKVGINEPFSNSKTFSVPVKYHSVMIEINKRLYMDEETLEKKEDFMWIHQILQSLYKMLLRKD